MTYNSGASYWRMFGASDSLRGASRGQPLSLIQIRIVEVAAAGNCFWYDDSSQVKRLIAPGRPPSQNRFVVETFPPRLAYKGERQWLLFPSEELLLRPFTLDLEHS